MLLCLVFVWGCHETATVSVEPNSKPDHVTLRVTKYRTEGTPIRTLRGIVVSICAELKVDESDAVVWRLTYAAQGNRRVRVPTAFTVGVAPDSNWKSEGPATSLQPGCYEVNVSGIGLGGGTRFAVTEDRRIVPLGSELRIPSSVEVRR